jgi:starch synthase
VGLFTKAASVQTIHNLAHQGHFPGRVFADLDLPARWFAPWALEYHGNVNYLKGGILHADRVTTVSPTYAREIRTSWGGFGLDSALVHRGDAVTGILNGIDPRIWDPRNDPHAGARYDADDLSGKRACKAGLQAELGLPADPTVPIVGSVGRLDPQKGVDLFTESVPWLVEEMGAQVAVVGSAAAEHRRYEDHLRWLERKYPHHVRAWIGYSEPMSHQITAGADVLAMPSLFEPCGLAQMYAQRYGTPPIVRVTGGLADSVIPCDDGALVGTGWTFHQPDGYDLRNALWRALTTWKRRPEAFASVQRRAMALDFSWDGRIGEYVAVYEAAKSLRA